MNSFITRIQLHYCALKPLRWAFLLPSPISRYKTEIQAISHLPKGTRGGRGQVVSDHCLWTLKSKHDRAREINSPKEKASIVHFTLEKEKKKNNLEKGSWLDFSTGAGMFSGSATWPHLFLGRL